MRRTSALLSIFALFLSGLSIGALGMHLYYAAVMRPPGPPGGGPPYGHLMRVLDRNLDLTPEQREKIAAIHRESHAASEALRREMRPRIEQQMEETRERIREILTPEQQEKFDELHRRHHGRFGRFFLGEGPYGRRGRSHGPPPDQPDGPPPDQP